MNLSLPRLPYPGDKLFGWLFFIALVVPLAFSVFNYESFEIIKYALLLIATGGAMLAAWGDRTSTDRSLRGTKNWFYILGLFWVWSLLASIFAWDKNYSFFGFYPRFTSGLLFYSVWPLLLLLLSMLQAEQIKFLLKVLVLCSGLVAVWGLLQSVGLGFYLGPTTDFFSRSAPSFLGNPDFSSMFVAGLLPLALVFLYQSKTPFSRLYYIASIFLQLWALIVFASRGALLALAVGFCLTIVLALWFLRKQALKLVLVFIFTAVVSLILGQQFLNLSRPQTVQTIITLDDNNIHYRLGVWQLAAKSIIKRPLFGVGLGNFELMFEHDRQSSIVASGFFDDAHNLPLELAVTGGLPLFIFFISLLLIAAWAALKGLKHNFELQTLAVVGSLAAWLTASLFTPVAIPCYVVLALLISACFMDKDQAFKLSNFRRPAVKTIALFIGGALLLYGCLFLTAETVFFSAVRTYNGGNYGKAYKEASIAIWLNPVNRLYYVYRAGSAIRQGQPLPAVTKFIAQVNNFAPERADSYAQLASLQYLLLYRTQNPIYRQQILDNLETAVKLDPFSSTNYSLLAQYQLVFGDLQAAQDSLKMDLSINPMDLQAQIFLAKTYQLQNDRPGLLAALRRAYDLEPDNVELARLLRAVEQSNNLQTLPFNLNFDLGRLD